MEFLSSSASYILPFLIVLTIVVFIHELGHYLVARYNGVKIEVFSIGFGPELFGWNDRVGTRWKFSLIPLGGYVRMYGDADASSKPDADAFEKMSEEDKQHTLQSKTVGQRIAVVSAGPIANYILAIVVMTGLFAIKGQPFMPSTVGTILKNSVAQENGLKLGDRITKINDTVVADFHELCDALKGMAGKNIDLTVRRKNTETMKEDDILLNVSMTKKDSKTGERVPSRLLGVRPGEIEYTYHNPLQSFTRAITTTVKISVDTLGSLVQMIRGERSSEELGGILAIGDMAGKSAKSGAASLFWFIALLSINLGLINLLPVPVLDGGHILFYSIEGIRGKPVSHKAQEYAFFIGLCLVMSLMLMSTWNDLMRYKVLSWIPFFGK